MFRKIAVGVVPNVDSLVYDTECLLPAATVAISHLL
jgi:hypothetical protein